MRSLSVVSISCLALALSACAHAPPAPPPVVVAAPAPEPVRPRFTIEAGANDTWNAVGQILVRTPGAAYDGRASCAGAGACPLLHDGAETGKVPAEVWWAGGMIGGGAEAALGA